MNIDFIDVIILDRPKVRDEARERRHSERKVREGQDVSMFTNVIDSVCLIAKMGVVSKFSGKPHNSARVPHPLLSCSSGLRASLELPCGQDPKNKETGSTNPRDFLSPPESHPMLHGKCRLKWKDVSVAASDEAL